MRRALLAVLAVLAFATPAQAQEPSPNVIKFAAGQSLPLTASGAEIRGECSETAAATGGWDGRAYMPMPCGYLSISFPQQDQAIVEFYVRVRKGAATTFVAFRDENIEVARQTVSTPDVWTPVILTGTFDSVYGFPAPEMSAALDLDDVAFSTVRQPGTEIASAPATVAFGETATFTFRSSVEGASYRCSVDGGPSLPCSNPAPVSGLPPGAHTLDVVAVDVYGLADATPARATFTVLAPVVVDTDADGRPDSTDNCPANANSDQADADADGVGNACDALPPGNVPPEPGETSVVRALSGEVFVKLPARTRLGFRGMRAPFQDGGFVPLKGVASVPIGSTVDTRRGEVSVQSAANGFAPSDRRAKRGEARIRAAIFALRQKRKKARSAGISTDVALLSPPGAEARCVGAPPKGTVVRSVSMVAKGLYRTIGGASTATARSATFNTTDRCDGTLTEVGRGRVTLTVKGKKRAKPVNVRAGRAYLVKAKLFAVRKGRRPISAR